MATIDFRDELRLAATRFGQRRPDLQGMRAIAVLTVFADHLFEWPPGGFVGVDVFFVLSGFFITGLLIRERATTGKVSFQNFYVRRIKRILPSATLVLTATVFAAHQLFPATRAREALLDALYASIFAANFRFEAVGADYFQQGQPPSPIQHYWSLSIEEQFYFVWPALLVILFAVTRRQRRRGRIWIRQWTLLLSMAAIVGISFSWALQQSVESPNSAYFSTFTRVWELGIGALVAIAGPWLVHIPDAIRPALAYVGLAGVAASLLVIKAQSTFPAPWAALPVLSTALVVASFHGAEARGMVLLTNPVARYFGDTSYTLYLWHWPVIVLLQSVIAPGPMFFVVATVLALGLTEITYRFFESPIRRSTWLADDERGSRRAFALSPWLWGTIGMLAVCGIIVSILSVGYSQKIAAAEAERAEQRIGSSQEVDLGPELDDPDPCFGAPAMVNPSCMLRDPEMPLRPSIDDFANDRPSGVSDCFTLKNERMRSCKFGTFVDGAPRIALVGDSHAAFLLPALRRIVENNNWGLKTFLGTPCYLMDPAPVGCAATMATAKAELLKEPYDLVLITNRNSQGDPNAYVRAWEPIVAAGGRFAVILDNPETTQDAIACLTRLSIGADHTGDCGTPQNQGFRYVDPLRGAAEAVPGTEIIDLTRFYCRDYRCPSVIGNVIVYQDMTHLTATFARTLSQPIEEALRRALNG